jgi:Tfp pilus assembly protein PilP
MNIVKKILIISCIVFPLMIILPSTLVAQQTKEKANQKKEEKKKDDKKETAAPQQTTTDKKATESDLKAPEENMDTVQDMTVGQGEVWNPENRRDPFASLIQKVAKSGAEEYKVLTREGKRPDGIEGMELKDIQLVGIFFIKGVYKAMFVGSDDYPYLLISGSQIWDGRIKEIDFSCVTFEQETEDLRFLVRRMKPVKRCLETE